MEASTRAPYTPVDVNVMAKSASSTVTIGVSDPANNDRPALFPDTLTCSPSLVKMNSFAVILVESTSVIAAGFSSFPVMETCKYALLPLLPGIANSCVAPFSPIDSTN